jgi:serine/threonine protein kinase
MWQVAHRDIKLENLMLRPAGDGSMMLKVVTGMQSRGARVGCKFAELGSCGVLPLLICLVACALTRSARSSPILGCARAG